MICSNKSLKLSCSERRSVQRKICNNSLHFLGQEWEHDPLNEENIKETGVKVNKEAEAGRENNANPKS